MKRSWLILNLLTLTLFTLPLSVAQANGQEKVCFCHNINHNPITICTANPALINAHMKHVDGDVPGVLDDLEICLEEVPELDCDDFTIDGYELEDWDLIEDIDEIPFEEVCIPEEDIPGDDFPGEDIPDDGSNIDWRFIDEPSAEIEGDQIALDSSLDGFDESAAFDSYGLLEGSGCSLSPVTQSGLAWFWLLLGALPLFRCRNGNKSS